MFSSIVCLLAFTSFMTSILSMMGKCPISVPVFFLAFIQLLHCVPIGR